MSPHTQAGSMYSTVVAIKRQLTLPLQGPRQVITSPGLF